MAAVISISAACAESHRRADAHGIAGEVSRFEKSGYQKTEIGTPFDIPLARSGIEWPMR
jgi:hypothetical protein